MRPDRSFLASISGATREGVRSASENLAAMAGLLVAMAAIVVAYYYWPAAASFLSRFGAWIHVGGLFRTALAAGFAGGILSEVSSVYLSDQGRWTAKHVENMAFRFCVFFVSGAIVSVFYSYQAVWFGQGTGWRALLPKVLVDQLIYSAFWCTPYQAILFRWQALRFSSSRLWRELDGAFIIERMLPVLITNWMFWFPGVALVYSMPTILQMPLNIFATAIWSLLLAGLAKPAAAPIAGAAQAVVMTGG